jgi:hypothetical protein
MPRLRKMLIILVAGSAMCALEGCQSNKAGKPGYVPTNCAMPGSSCDLERW